jgi:hypothetical protein
MRTNINRQHVQMVMSQLNGETLFVRMTSRKKRKEKKILSHTSGVLGKCRKMNEGVQRQLPCISPPARGHWWTKKMLGSYTVNRGQSPQNRDEMRHIWASLSPNHE